jgi:hypothetical protein
MSRKVCFIDEEGQTATCINEDTDCANCQYNDDAHKKWVSEQTPKETPLLDSIRNREVQFNLNFIDDDIIICGVADSRSKEIQVMATTRCFDEDKPCADYDCIKCPYSDKSKQEAIYNKYEMTVVEILKDAYKKIEALR